MTPNNHMNRQFESYLLEVGGPVDVAVLEGPLQGVQGVLRRHVVRLCFQPLLTQWVGSHNGARTLHLPCTWAREMSRGTANEASDAVM